MTFKSVTPFKAVASAVVGTQKCIVAPDDSFTKNKDICLLIEEVESQRRVVISGGQDMIEAVYKATKMYLNNYSLYCCTCEYRKKCQETYGTYFGVMKGTPNCKKSYERFGDGPTLSKRETGRAKE